MKRFAAAALLLLLLPGCSSLSQKRATDAPQPAPASAPAAADPAEPRVTPTVQWHEIGKEERPGDGTVYLLASPAHIWVTLPYVTGSLQWRLGGILPFGAEVATLTPKLVDGKWVLDWYDPPAQPMRMTLYAEVPASEPDSPKYLHDGDKRWNPIASGLVRLQGELSAEKTGVVVGSPAGLESVRDVVRQYFALTAKGSYEDAWSLLHPTAQQPNPATTRDQRHAAFLQAKPVPAPAEIEAVQRVEGWKYYDCQCQVGQTAEVTLRQNNGQVLRIHAAPDEKGDWRLFWDPANGLQ